MTECGQRVVIMAGDWPCTDHSKVARGEIGWVIGHQGPATAVVHFDTQDHGKSADIPIVNLRVLTVRNEGR